MVKVDGVVSEIIVKVIKCGFPQGGVFSIYVNDVLVASISFINFRTVLEERKINKLICNACEI